MLFEGQSVLITGGTGSFGRAFVQRVLERYEPRRVIIYSCDELKQSEMAEQLRDKRLRFCLGGVRDLDRLQRAMNDVQVVVHSAALSRGAAVPDGFSYRSDPNPERLGVPEIRERLGSLGLD